MHITLGPVQVSTHASRGAYSRARVLSVTTPRYCHTIAFAAARFAAWTRRRWLSYERYDRARKVTVRYIRIPA